MTNARSSNAHISRRIPQHRRIHGALLLLTWMQAIHPRKTQLVFDLGSGLGHCVLDMYYRFLLTKEKILGSIKQMLDLENPSF